MNAKVNYKDGRVTVFGELNFGSVMDVWNQSLVFFTKNDVLEFNFSDVTHVNSAALALMLEWIKYAKQKNKRISFSQLPSQLVSIAKVSGVDKMF